MRITVGLTKKVGLPGYGSLAASCQVESFEFSAGLSSADFSRRVRQAFDACRHAVEEELLRRQEMPRATPPQTSAAPHEGSGQRPATPKQLSALRGLAAKSRLTREEINRVFGGKPLDALSVQEASAAIDRLKGAAGGGAGNGMMKGAV
jgi:hypothetical protein